MLYQCAGESGGRSRPLRPGAATALRRCPKASPSRRQPKRWVEGGCGEGLRHPSSALQDGVLGLLLPAASEQGSVSIWIWWPLARAKAAGRGPGAGGRASGADPSFGFRFLLPFSRYPSKHPFATVQALGAFRSAQHGRDGQSTPSSLAGLLSHSFPSKEVLKIECRAFTEHYLVQTLS